MTQPSLDLEFVPDDAVPDDEGLPTYGVGELVDAINGALRRSFFDGVWVRGEIQGWRETANGHAYFDLVDERDGRKSTLAVSWFANARVRLRPLLAKHRLRLGDGLKVRIHGYLDMYAPTGRLSLKMSGLDPRYTLGELALQRDDVIRRLVAAGLFDANRQRALPALPLTVGVVSSVGSAAWHDFTHELEVSGIGFDLHVVDVRVQGEWAVEMVAGAISRLGRERGIDVIVVIRGGGARSDLATFDAEQIALAIAMSPRPVLTGLGHEVDRSVADEVAHLSLKTPTACAGALVERVRAFGDRVDRAWTGLTACTAAAVSRSRADVDAKWQRMEVAARRQIDLAAARVDAVDTHAGAFDPVLTLARGWSITRTSDGVLVRTVAQAAPGGQIVTTVADGDINSTVAGGA